MTKEQIIGALKAAAKPYEEYYIDDEVVDAINTYSNPYELVAPNLEIIADNPSVDLECRENWYILLSSSIKMGMKNC